MLTFIQEVYSRSLYPAWRRFSIAASCPRKAQEGRLKALVYANAQTAYGLAHKFNEIDSVASYQSHVPIITYDEMSSWIDRIAAGEVQVLTHEPVRMLERTSGSTSANKLVPYTTALLHEYSAASGPWLYDLFRALPKLKSSRSYWSVSPATRQKETTSGGLPIGFEDDAEYFGPVAAWALRKTMAVPSSVARLPDTDQWRRQTCLYLLGCHNLGLISVWSPTFLCLLMDYIHDNLSDLLKELPSARADEIRRGMQLTAGALTGDAIWPDLCLVSCWMDGASSHFLPELKQWFPRTPFQAKGLLATEGVISFPLCGYEGSVAAVASHFIEFLDIDHPQNRPLLMDDLKRGGTYSPVISTAGGLYRYHLKDVVECVGHYSQTPLLRFAGKLESVSDLCGEKLSARHIEGILRRVQSMTAMRWRFAMMAPVDSRPSSYCLFVDTDAGEEHLSWLASELETMLCESHHYKYCRTLGQLAPVSIQRVKHGWTVYQATLASLGMRIGNIKPTCLDNRLIWQDAFSSSRVERSPSCSRVLHAQPF